MIDTLILNAELELDLEYGFAWAVHEETNLFQVCLVARKDGKGFKKEIDGRDCGWNDGLCGDHNQTDDPANLQAFLKLARAHGVRVK